MATQREYIVEQALQMFLQEGIKSVRMDDIAQRLGISKRTLYELFGDKETLLYEAMLHYRDQTACDHAKITETAHDVLEEMFLVLAHVLESSTAGHHHMHHNLKKFYPAVWEKIFKDNQNLYRGKLRIKLQEGIAGGLIRGDINVELAISILYATATALNVQPTVIVIPEGMSEQDALVQTLSCYFRGISTPKGEELIDKYMRQYKFK